MCACVLNLKFSILSLCAIQTNRMSVKQQSTFKSSAKEREMKIGWCDWSMQWNQLMISSHRNFEPPELGSYLKKTNFLSSTPRVNFILEHSDCFDEDAPLLSTVLHSITERIARIHFELNKDSKTELSVFSLITSNFLSNLMCIMY